MTFIVILFWLYFLAYILMGFYQPIDAICRLLKSRKVDTDYTKGLKKYLLSVIVYFLILIGMYAGQPHFDVEGFVIFNLFFLPWCFSIWYIIHIRIWNDKIEEPNQV